MRDTKRSRRWIPSAPREESYNALKRRWQDVVIVFARSARLRPMGENVAVPIAFTWFEPDRRRDPDGIASGGTKLILDGLVDAGVLTSDRHEHVSRLSHQFDFAETAGVLVVLNEVARLQIPHRFPDLNELLRARELGARRMLARRAR